MLKRRSRQSLVSFYGASDKPQAALNSIGKSTVSVLVKLSGYALAILLCSIALPIGLSYDIPSSSFLLAAMASCLFGEKTWANSDRYPLAFI